MNNKILEDKSYQFLKRKIFKKNKICILVKDGYCVYGINLKDFNKHQLVKGICLNSKKEIESGEFEHFIISQDKDIHSSYIDILPLNTIIDKLINCQPEILSIFGVRDEDTIIITKEGKLLKDNIGLFLNRYNIYRSFRGFTLSLKQELEESISKIDKFTSNEKELNFICHINKLIKENEGMPNGIKLILDEDKSISLNVNIEKCSIKDLRYTMNRISDEYAKYKHANDPNSQDNDRIKRYAVNIIKTYLLGIDILSGNRISTYMPNPVFDEIINNKFTHKEILELIYEYDERFIYASKNSDLQEYPNHNGINELVDELNRRVMEDEV